MVDGFRNHRKPISTTTAMLAPESGSCGA
jgi:hypothetical protein